MYSFPAKFIGVFLQFQKRYTVAILLFGLTVTVLAAPRAVRLLTSIATELIHLLPDEYPSVRHTDEIQKKFNRRSSLFLIITSPDADANFRAMIALQSYLEKNPLVDRVDVKKRGYDFFDKNKLLLVELKDLYQIHDRLKDRIQKRKLSGLYIDFEEDDEKAEEVTFDDLIQKYKDEFAEGVRSKYRTNKDKTVYVLDIYPKSTDASLSFFKQFGDGIEQEAAKFDFGKYHPDMTYGYAGAIKTRVDQYDALIEDLKKAGLVSASSIFLLLYFYFGRFIDRKKGLKNYVVSLFMQFIPVVAIFLPMITSTILAFWFASFFFDRLNVVTSFLFAIIFGLGVDIGIHLIMRSIQDRCDGKGMDAIHHDVVTRTGKSSAMGILTTVASFYVLTINDFKGFSEFGWIAGNGLVVALLCYLTFMPCLLLLIDRFQLLRIRQTSFDVDALEKGRRRWLPYHKYLLVLFAAFTLLSLVDLRELHFEWDFNKLKMKLEHREHQKDLLKQTYGRVNSPAVYLVENAVQARRIAKELRERKESDLSSPTIQFFRSYYDMIPFDQDEKLALLRSLDDMLADDALNTAGDEEKELIAEFRESIAGTERITEKDIPPDIYELFWGNTGLTDTSVGYVMPLPHLELDDGNNAQAFYEDVYLVETLKKRFYALSDSIVFAEVLRTLFRDANVAVFLTTLAIMCMTFLHYRTWREPLLIFAALGCGIFWMLGCMALFGLRLNFYNMIIIPAMIGMGEDNSIHVVDRFNEVKRRSLVAVLKTSGGAALMASLTTMLGYSGLCVSRHPGLQSIGWMAIIGMGTCLVASLVLLPVLLQLFLRPVTRSNE